MAFRVDIETMVLAVLERDELHGYEISRRIRERSSKVLSVGEGMLYPALHKLEQENLVASQWIPQEGRPAKKVYRLTPEGTKALAEKYKAWQTFAQGVGAVLRPAGAENA
ncbi:MAG: PadR family transcriptional regulator [Fimbriimonas sp.]